MRKVAAGLLLILAASVGFGDAALAGRSADYARPILHRRIPQNLASDMIVAEVQFADGDADVLFAGGVRAKVIRMFQGFIAAKYILVRGGKQSTCSSPFSRGLSGILVARRRIMDGQVVYEAVEAPSRGR